jgi:hypothetical protein
MRRLPPSTRTRRRRPPRRRRTGRFRGSDELAAPRVRALTGRHLAAVSLDRDDDDGLSLCIDVAAFGFEGVREPLNGVERATSIRSVHYELFLPMELIWQPALYARYGLHARSGWVLFQMGVLRRRDTIERERPDEERLARLAAGLGGR